MTAGDKIKLRAELAGKAMQGLIPSQQMWQKTSREQVIKTAVAMADAIMKELGLDGE